MRAQMVLDHLVIGYRGRPILSNEITLTIHRGEFWGIIGPNGSGKTTLIKTIVGILPPIRGSVITSHETFGYVPQRSALDDIFPLTVLDVVLMGRYSRIGPLRWVKRADRMRALHYLERVGMTHLADRPYRLLSSGQKQRTLMARALAAEPDVLILDEPTDGLDLAGERSVMKLIQDLYREMGLTILMVTHQLNLVADFAQKVMLIHGDEGRFETGTVEKLLNPQRLEEIYGLDEEER